MSMNGAGILSKRPKPLGTSIWITENQIRELLVGGIGCAFRVKSEVHTDTATPTSMHSRGSACGFALLNSRQDESSNKRTDGERHRHRRTNHHPEPPDRQGHLLRIAGTPQPAAALRARWNGFHYAVPTLQFGLSLDVVSCHGSLSLAKQERSLADQFLLAVKLHIVYPRRWEHAIVQSKLHGHHNGRILE